MNENKLKLRLQEYIEQLRKTIAVNNSGLRGLELQRYLLKKQAMLKIINDLEKIIEETNE